MTTQEVKKQYNMNQWISLIQECKSSGLSVKQWCYQNGIPEGNYYYWLKRIRIKAIEALPAIPTDNDPQKDIPENSIFTKVTLPQKSIATDITLSIHGIEIRLNNTATTELIHSVLLAVKQLW